MCKVFLLTQWHFRFLEGIQNRFILKYPPWRKKRNVFCSWYEIHILPPFFLLSCPSRLGLLDDKHFLSFHTPVYLYSRDTVKLIVSTYYKWPSLPCKALWYIFPHATICRIPGLKLSARPYQIENYQNYKEYRNLYEYRKKLRKNFLSKSWSCFCQ